VYGDGSGGTNIEVPRLCEHISILVEYISKESVLHLSLLQMVHVDMDAIYSR
jgi:hypothetical protein